MNHRGEIEIIGMALTHAKMTGNIIPAKATSFPRSHHQSREGTVIPAKAGIQDLSLHGSPLSWGNGSFYLYLRQNIRNDVKAKVGDTMAYSLVLDSSYENGPVRNPWRKPS